MLVLYALVYGRSRNIGFPRNFEKWLARIIGEHLKNLEIKSIEVLS